MKRLIQQDTFRHKNDMKMLEKNELYGFYGFLKSQQDRTEVQFGRIHIEKKPQNNEEMVCMPDKQEIKNMYGWHISTDGLHP